MQGGGALHQSRETDIGRDPELASLEEPQRGPSHSLFLAPSPPPITSIAPLSLPPLRPGHCDAEGAPPTLPSGPLPPPLALPSPPWPSPLPPPPSPVPSRVMGTTSTPAFTATLKAPFLKPAITQSGLRVPSGKKRMGAPCGKCGGVDGRTMVWGGKIATEKHDKSGKTNMGVSCNKCGTV